MIKKLFIMLGLLFLANSCATQYHYYVVKPEVRIDTVWVTQEVSPTIIDTFELPLQGQWYTIDTGFADSVRWESSPGGIDTAWLIIDTGGITDYPIDISLDSTIVDTAKWEVIW
jgi:hypothetical protein